MSEADRESSGQATSNVNPRAIQPSGISNFVLAARFFADTIAAGSATADSAIGTAAIANLDGHSFDSPGRQMGGRPSAIEPGTK